MRSFASQGSRPSFARSNGTARARPQSLSVLLLNRMKTKSSRRRQETPQASDPIQDRRGCRQRRRTGNRRHAKALSADRPACSAATAPRPHRASRLRHKQRCTSVRFHRIARPARGFRARFLAIASSLRVSSSETATPPCLMRPSRKASANTLGSDALIALRSWYALNCALGNRRAHRSTATDRRRGMGNRHRP